jgi:hypothetical protein
MKGFYEIKLNIERVKAEETIKPKPLFILPHQR